MGADSKFLRVGPEGVNRSPRKLEIKRKSPKKIFTNIETRKYHRGASVPEKIRPLPGTKYHCQRTKNRDSRQLTRVQ